MTNDQSRDLLSDTLRWAMEDVTNPSIAAADWLARDIDPERESAADLLTSPDVPLVQICQAKEMFKTMRMTGETAADRRLGAKLYAAAIASGLVHHNERITGQSDAALDRAFAGLRDDDAMPGRIRSLGETALSLLFVDRKDRSTDAAG